MKDALAEAQKRSGEDKPAAKQPETRTHVTTPIPQEATSEETSGAQERAEPRPEEEDMGTAMDCLAEILDGPDWQPGEE